MNRQQALPSGLRAPLWRRRSCAQRSFAQFSTLPSTLWRCRESNPGPRTDLAPDVYRHSRLSVVSRARNSADRASRRASRWSFASRIGVRLAARRLHDTHTRHADGVPGGHRCYLGSERELRLGSCGVGPVYRVWTELGLQSGRSRPRRSLSSPCSTMIAVTGAAVKTRLT